MGMCRCVCMYVCIYVGKGMHVYANTLYDILFVTLKNVRRGGLIYCKLHKEDDGSSRVGLYIRTMVICSLFSERQGQGFEEHYS